MRLDIVGDDVYIVPTALPYSTLCCRGLMWTSAPTLRRSTAVLATEDGRPYNNHKIYLKFHTNVIKTSVDFKLNSYKIFLSSNNYREAVTVIYLSLNLLRRERERERE
jgi:hypothetical protein